MKIRPVYGTQNGLGKNKEKKKQNGIEAVRKTLKFFTKGQ